MDKRKLVQDNSAVLYSDNPGQYSSLQEARETLYGDGAHHMNVTDAPFQDMMDSSDMEKRQSDLYQISPRDVLPEVEE
jgi:hypothetical protein